MKIGDRIRIRREAIGMSQDELSRRLGYSGRSTVSKIELNQRDLTQSKIVAFAEALGVTPLYLMGIEEEDTTANSTLSPERAEMKNKIDKMSDEDFDRFTQALRLIFPDKF